jgi:hypothetical protein
MDALDEEHYEQAEDGFDDPFGDVQDFRVERVADDACVTTELLLNSSGVTLM